MKEKLMRNDFLIQHVEMMSLNDIRMDCSHLRLIRDGERI